MIYLYIKQHSLTGLKYFGKTTRKDPFKYEGSGIKWSNHINKHGKEHIQTLEIWGFDNQDLCTEFALKFSKDNNIVEEKINGKKTWANLIDENGVDGFPTGKTNPSLLEKNLLRMKQSNPMSTLRTNKGTYKKGRKYKQSDSHKQKLREAKLGSNNPNYGKFETGLQFNKRSNCNHCGVESNNGNISRWHNDNCKLYTHTT